MSAAQATARAESDRSKPVMRIGLISDIHYADRPDAGGRFYRHSIAKVREAAEYFDGLGVEFLVQMGDLMDEGETPEMEASYLSTVDTELRRLAAERHCVLGNHCVWSLSKEEFLKQVGAQKSYYSFDRLGFHFVVLDACFRSDGVPYGRRNFEWRDSEIPPDERAWLAEDLEKTSLPTVVFVHQRLDVAGDFGVKSAPAVRAILERSGRTRAVFQGHNHLNDHKEMGGIHYVTLDAVVERPAPSNAFGVLSFLADGTLELEGKHRQRSYTLKCRDADTPTGGRPHAAWPSSPSPPPR